MIIQGKITDQNGTTIPGANIYVSDAAGNVLNPPTGTQSDANGTYKLNIASGSYVTASFVGMKRIVKQVFDIQCIQAPCNEYNFKLESGNPLEIVEVTAKKPFPWLIAVAVTIITVGLGYFIIDISKQTK